MATEAAPPRYEPDEWWVPTATDAAAARSDGAGDGRSEYGRAVSALARLQARRRAARSRELYGAHVAEGRAWAPFVATKMEVVREMLAFAVAGRADVVVDLGAGDGRIALCAAIERDVARARGIELDEKLVTRARAAAAKHGLDGGAGDTIPQLHDYMQRAGLSRRELTALVGGCHSLGEMSDGAAFFVPPKKYNGTWTTDPTTVSNEYFVN